MLADARAGQFDVVVCHKFVAVFAASGIAVGQVTGPGVLSHEVQSENTREITSPPQLNAPQAPAISFIDSPSATCYQPDARHQGT
jgi:hypothetical protein